VGKKVVQLRSHTYVSELNYTALFPFQVLEDEAHVLKIKINK